MAITDLASLKTSIDAWADINGTLDDYLTDFVTFTTNTFNHGSEQIPPMRVREMVAVTSLTPVSGVCTLPTDYLQYRRVVEDAATRRELTYIAPNVTEQDYNLREAGLSNDFTIVGSSLYMFPVSTNDIELTYYQAIPALSADDDTNWLLTKYPEIYLHGALFQAALFRRDDELAQRSAQMVVSYMAGMATTDLLSNYSYAPVRARGVHVA